MAWRNLPKDENHHTIDWNGDPLVYAQGFGTQCAEDAAARQAHRPLLSRLLGRTTPSPQPTPNA